MLEDIVQFVPSTKITMENIDPITFQVTRDLVNLEVRFPMSNFIDPQDPSTRFGKRKESMKDLLDSDKKKAKAEA